jgi:hypothetical protein
MRWLMLNKKEENHEGKERDEGTRAKGREADDSFDAV